MITQEEQVNFDEWMKKVDAAINENTGYMGLTSSDLVDFLYYDAYEDGASPEEVAIEAMQNDDIFAGFVP